MSFGSALLLVVFSGVVMSFIALRREFITRTPWFRWGGVALFVVVLVILRKSIVELQWTHVLMIAGVCLFWTPFFVMVLWYTVLGLTRSALSLDNVVVRPTYSLAEAAEAKRELTEAIRLYREAAAEYPQESEPYRRMGEIFLRLDQPGDALRAFREASDRQADPEQKMILVFAMAEVLADRRQDVPGALAVLEGFRERHPDAPGGEFLAERIERLKERIR